MSLFVLWGFCGCDEAEPAVHKKAPAKTETPKQTAEPETARLNTDALDMLGKTYEEVKSVWGKPTETVWEEGVCYVFSNGESTVLFSFKDEEDLDKTEPELSSECFAFRSSLDNCILGLDNGKPYTREELSDLTGTGIEEAEYNIMDDTYGSSFTYNGTEILIFDMSKEYLHPDSSYVFARLDK